jgi:hypothetical protein
MSSSRTPPTDEQIRAAAMFAAWLAGCTCSPSIKLRCDEYGIRHAEIAHDADCEHPSQQKGRDT